MGIIGSHVGPYLGAGGDIKAPLSISGPTGEHAAEWNQESSAWTRGVKKVSQESSRCSAGCVGMSDVNVGTSVMLTAPCESRSRSAFAIRWLGRAIEMLVDRGRESVPRNVGSSDVITALAV